MNSDPAPPGSGRIPSGVAAVLAALRFDDAPVDALATIRPEEWNSVLGWCDRNQLTLPLAHACLDALPRGARERVLHNLESNRIRNARVRQALDEIIARFKGLQFIVLKGLTQAPDFVPDIETRVQYDLDFFLPNPAVYAARDALLSLQYEPASGYDQLPTDHLPVMVRKTGWQWRDDYFDPEIPPSVDLHYRFWDAETECFEAPGTEEFWGRRTVRSGLPALHIADAVAYSSLHLLRHLLRGSLRPFHVYELAYFLKNRENDTAFWTEWRTLHPAELRGVQMLAFELAQRWFGCPVPCDEPLSELAVAWFDQYALSPIEGQFHPNKHELWLHLTLLDSNAAKWRVIRRRILPTRPPGVSEPANVPASKVTPAIRRQHRIAYFKRLSERAVHHTRVIPSVAWHGFFWWVRTSGVNRSLGSMLAATAVFNLGNFVFFVLYNLHLLRIGFREDFIGAVATAMTVGSMAGTLPGGWLAQRFELRRSLPACAVAISILFLVRTWAASKMVLLAAAGAHGFVFSCWAVMMLPAVARLTDERSRATGFSLFMASGIAMGVVGGFVAGGLPRLIAPWVQGVDPSQTALYFSSAMVAASVPLLLRLPRLGVKERESRLYPSGTFFWKFLGALSVWHFATGIFNPFFNAFFARHLSASTPQIGAIFSASQLAQIAALLVTPVLFGGWSSQRAISVAQLIAGTLLMLLSISATLPVGAIFYVTYMAAQYSSQPRIFSLLMGGVRTEQQGGASALNFLASFSSEALAAALSGEAIYRFGYSPVLAAAGFIACIAALLFLRLRNEAPDRAENAAAKLG